MWRLPVCTTWLLYTTLYISVTSVSSKPSQETYERLLSSVLSDYSVTTPAFSPFYGNNKIFVKCLPVAVLGIDDVRQILSVQLFLQSAWVDPRLSWDPDQFGGITDIQLPVDRVWLPKMQITNSVDKTKMDATIPVSVMYNGLVARRLYGVSSTTCSLHLSRYPFDEQRCKVSISGTLGSHYHYHLTSTDFTLGNYFRIRSEWTLLKVERNVLHVSINSSSSYVYDIAEYVLVLRRKSSFYVVTTIFPMFLLSFLTPFVFILPDDSDAKFGYVICIMVSYAVFLEFITESMPKTSTSVSSLELYLVLTLLHCVLAILTLLVLTNRRHRRGDADRIAVATLGEDKTKSRSRFSKFCFKLKTVARFWNRVAIAVFLVTALLMPTVFLY